MRGVKPPSLATCTWLWILPFLTGLSVSVCAGQGNGSASDAKLTALDLIALAKSPGPKLALGITSSLDQKQLASGTAWLAHGPDFFFALQAASKPQLFVDDAPGPAVERLRGSDLWYATARIEPVGRSHSFYYLVGGSKFGGSL
jgi:hypothetical protein